MVRQREFFVFYPSLAGSLADAGGPVRLVKYYDVKHAVTKGVPHFVCRLVRGKYHMHPVASCPHPFVQRCNLTLVGGDVSGQVGCGAVLLADRLVRTDNQVVVVHVAVGRPLLEGLFCKRYGRHQIQYQTARSGLFFRYVQCRQGLAGPAGHYALAAVMLPKAIHAGLQRILLMLHKSMGFV